MSVDLDLDWGRGGAIQLEGVLPFFQGHSFLYSIASNHSNEGVCWDIHSRVSVGLT